jgi:hypothetical protein
MPLKLQILSDQAAKWVNACKHKLYELKAMRHRGDVLRATGAFPQGVMYQVISMDDVDIIRIWGGAVAGFICHPRSDVFPGGITPKGTPISAIYAYPLIDNDHGSFVLTGINDKWTVSRDVENYGNLDWDGSEVLTWRGPPGRSIPLPNTTNVSGLSTLLETIGVDIYYTPYSGNIYQHGNVVAVAPGLVLGAAIYSGGIIAVVALKNPGWTQAVYTGAVGAKATDWTLVSNINNNFPQSAWFFSDDTTEATDGNTLLTIVYSKNSVTVGSTALSSGNGTYHFNAMPYTETKSGNWQEYGDFKTALNRVSISMQSSDATTGSAVNATGGNSSTGSFPMEFINHGTLAIQGGETLGVGASFNVVNGVAPYTWSAGGASFSGQSTNGITITALNGSCGAQTVSVTDACGFNTSIPVRAPGQWILVSDIDNNPGPGGTPPGCAPGCSSSWDENWLYSNTTVDGGRCTGSFPGNNVLAPIIVSYGDVASPWVTSWGVVTFTATGFCNCRDAGDYGPSEFPCHFQTWAWEC